MEIKECYDILEVDADASLDEIRVAYRDLIAIWHPDKYVHNKRLYDKATKKVQEINLAFESIEANYFKCSDLKRTPPDDKANDVNFDLVICKNCSTKNRVPHQADRAGFLCGKCQKHLYINPIKKGGSTSIDKITFGEARFDVDGINYKGNAIRYNSIETVYYYNVRRSLNAMPTTHDFAIKIKLNSGKKIELFECIDIRPAVTRIPLSKIFDSKIRNNKKQEISENIDKIHTRFIYSLAFIKKFSQVQPMEKAPWY